MPKSQIIKDIVEDSVSLEKSLTRLLVLAKDVRNSKLVQWAEKELKGYKEDADIPNYRRTESKELQYSGINNRFQVTSIPLPIGWISKDIMDQIFPIAAYESIRLIEELATGDDTIMRDMTALAGEIRSNSNGAVSCTSNQQLIPRAFFFSICADLKNKLITAIIELEKKYGNLDGLGIDISDKPKVQIERINSDLNNAVFQINVPQQEAVKEPWYSKIAWKVIVPIVTAILSAVGTAIIIKFLG